MRISINISKDEANVVDIVTKFSHIIVVLNKESILQIYHPLRV